MATTTASARILFLADTHLGFDHTFRPRVQRRRRGADFFANYERALQPAFENGCDLVVHGGDLLFRSRVPAHLVEMACAPLRRVADHGVPVVLVPGNHERSQIPYRLLAAHPHIHVFDRPHTFVLRFDSMTLALAGFPYERDAIRLRFAETLASTGWCDAQAQVKLLCMHQCVEGATVGPADYTFRSAADVVRADDLPNGLAAVLSGHIHRHQVLTRDLRGRPLRATVLYPGSIERTSFAEMGEAKGYLMLEVCAGDAAGGTAGGTLAGWRFHELPTRPMLRCDIQAEGAEAADLEMQLKRAIQSAPDHAVLQLRLRGDIAAEQLPLIGAARLRSLAPPTMNVEVSAPGLRKQSTTMSKHSGPHTRLSDRRR